MPKSSSLITPPIDDAVATNVDPASISRDDAAREKWQCIIDRTLIEWGRDSAQCDDEGIEPTSA